MASGTDCPAHLPSDSQLFGLSILILMHISRITISRFRTILDVFIYQTSPFILFIFLFFSFTFGIVHTFSLVLLIMTRHHHGVQHHRWIWFLCVVFYLDRLFIFLFLGEAWAICLYFLFSVFASSGVAWIWRCTCGLPSTLLSTLVACFRIHLLI